MTTETTTRTFTVKGNSFESTHTDQQVRDGLKAAIDAGDLRSNFAADLIAGRDRYGSWTPGRQAWAHKIYLEVLSRKQHDANKVLEPGFEKIVSHLQAARDRRENGGAGLLNPMVRIGNGDPAVLNGTQFCLKLVTSARSKHRGKVSVAQSSKFRGGDFYGYIDTEGNFDGYSRCTEHVKELLRRIAQDPVKVIVELGKESGLCCYCHAGLTQVQSKIAGCGKTCSRNYATWYPNAAETREYLVEHPQLLVGATDRTRWEN